MLSFPICRTAGESCRPVGFFATRPLSTASYRRPRRWSGTLPFSKPTSCELSAAEQGAEDRALWYAERPDWHAQLSLDVTDLYIRYLKSGPGKLEKDVERRFSYALSREDIKNAILGGP
ncbi:hypothetical protein HPP92_011456 [Vanilla planifolia]|uniref:Uncharacterized protein n=1 Tax=Vanilla planifolia TaxID=51239 RepID=A0A835QZ43_VANPL|nr:hypothetical protein HPP92_011456 [Vanilla planifolia]